jgi:hypothetical protein
LLSSPTYPKSTVDRLRDADDLEKQKGFRSDSEAGLATLRRLAELADDAPISYAAAFSILEAAHNELPENTTCPWVEEDEFLTAIGVSNTNTFDHDEDWTAGLVRRGLAIVVKHGRLPMEKLTAWVDRAIEEHLEEIRCRIKELTAEQKRLKRQERAEIERKRNRRMLPDGDAEAKVLRYENHLTRHLYQTLHELERLQAARAGRPVPVPLAVEVGVNVSATDAESE